MKEIKIGFGETHYIDRINSKRFFLGSEYTEIIDSMKKDTLLFEDIPIEIPQKELIEKIQSVNGLSERTILKNIYTLEKNGILKCKYTRNSSGKIKILTLNKKIEFSVLK